MIKHHHGDNGGGLGPFYALKTAFEFIVWPVITIGGPGTQRLQSWMHSYLISAISSVFFYIRPVTSTNVC